MIEKKSPEKNGYELITIPVDDDALLKPDVYLKLFLVGFCVDLSHVICI